ncbi:MAG: helix-turn-helix domain-containing protein [Nitrososphaerota archaeon]|nr:helix-turn-helix domain-containing protein [Nitrososphaerota archaeon]
MDKQDGDEKGEAARTVSPKPAASTGGGVDALRREAPAGDQAPRAQRAFKLLSNPANALILSALMGAESYPRQIAQKLSMRESHVSERLRALEELGLVKSRWTRAAGQDKNVKAYSSTVSSLRIGIDAGGMKLETAEGRGRPIELGQPMYSVTIPTVRTFVGRKRELEALKREAAGLTVVTGMAGIGKTTLLSKYAEVVSSTGRRPGGVFWHDLRESDSFRYVLAKLGRFLEGQGRGGLSRLLRSGASEEDVLIGAAVNELRRGKFLLVFDDFHFCRDSGVTRLIRRLAEPKGARTVVASRTRPTELYVGSDFVSELSLGGHSEAEAMRLFAENGVRMGRSEISRINARLKGHPLGLTLACNSVKAMGRDRAVETALSKVRDHVLFSVESALGSQELGTLRDLAVLRGLFPLEAARAVQPDEVRDEVLLHRITALERAGVVTRTGSEFAVHDLVREAVGQPPGSSAGAHARAAAYYELAGDRRSSLEAIYHFVKAGRSGDAVRKYFSNDESTKIADGGYVEPLLRLCEELLTSTAQSQGEEGRARGWLMVVRACMLWRTQRSYALALRSARGAGAIGRQYGDRALVAASFLNEAYVLSALGNARGAERACRMGLGVPGIETENPAGAAYLMESLADLMASGGKFEEAIRFGSSAVRLFQGAGDQRNIAGSMVALAVYHYMKGDIEGASSLLTKAREEVPPGNKMIAEYIEEASGLVMERAGKKAEALLHFNRGIRLAKESGNRHALLEVQSERMLLRCKLGDLAGAKREMTGALELKQTTERRYSLGVLELAGAGIALAGGSDDECRAHLRKAGLLLSDDAVSRGRVEWWGGVADSKEGRQASSRRRLAKAKKLFEDVGADGYARQVAALSAEIEASPPRTAREALALVW